MIPKRIILHHSLTKDGQTVNWSAIKKYHTETRGWKDIGYHYGVELVNGQYMVLVGRFMDTKGAHALGANRDSLGICLIGDFSLVPPPQAQWETAVRLVKSLVYVLMLPKTEVYGHCEAVLGYQCPGNAFDLDLFRSQL
jgi:hypothetical protein